MQTKLFNISTHVQECRVLRPYPRVNHSNDDSLASVPLPSDHRPRVLGYSQEPGRVGGARANNVVLLDEGHGGVLLQQAHLGGSEAGGKGVEGMGVTAGRTRGVCV